MPDCGGPCPVVTVRWSLPPFTNHLFPPPQLTLKPEQTMLPLVDKACRLTTTQGISFQYPEIIAHADLVTRKLPEPYYWRLPEQFQGSMVITRQPSPLNTPLMLTGLGWAGLLPAVRSLVFY